jgi:hypothetical protein
VDLLLINYPLIQAICSSAIIDTSLGPPEQQESLSKRKWRAITLSVKRGHWMPFFVLIMMGGTRTINLALYALCKFMTDAYQHHERGAYAF